MERLGIVGLPNSGKSSLFNALTGGSAQVAAHPFSTTETTVGVAQVPDDRLDQLAVMSASRKVVHATVEFVDIAGLVAGSSTGEGLGNRFLAGIREADALCLVLRAFADDNVAGDADPVSDLGVLELELVLADVATVDSQIDKRRKAAKSDKTLAGEVAALERAQAQLEAGTPIYRSELDGGRASHAAAVVPADQQAGAGRGQSRRGPGRGDRRHRQAGGRRARRPRRRARRERETGGGGGPARSEESRTELLEGLGLGEGALPRVARAAYHLLGRRTFLTTGDKESRAWTFRAGAKAPECAGVIHSDLQRGFIRAEVIRWDELLRLGSWQAAKEAGKLRVEGKDYEVVDGDVLEIRFNV